MDTQPNPNQFARDAWDANADVWDSRMGDEGNDFFKKTTFPTLISWEGPASYQKP